MSSAAVKLSYRSTLVACSIANFVLATVINLTPILFIPLRQQYGLSFSQLGFLIFVNFITQVTFDLAFSRSADRHGFRPFVKIAHVLIFIGFILFATLPQIMPNPYPGLLIATIIFSGGGGLLELLISPIVDAVPDTVKSTTMAFMHSFYAWGQVVVILVTTFLIFFFDASIWPFIVLFWALFPAANFFLFLKVPIAPQRPVEHLMRIRDLIRQPLYLLAIAAIMFGAASELTMNQWTSAYMEVAMGLPKIVGDTVGMSLFAVMMGVGRTLYGFFGAKINVSRVMILGSLLAAICYLVVAITPYPALGLAACAVCGLAVSLLWPGTLVVAARRFPLAGASLFAILAAGGDVGASLGPWALGLVTEKAPGWAFLSNLIESSSMTPAQFGLRAGMFIGIAFPLVSLVSHLYLKRSRKMPAPAEHTHT